MLTYRLENVPSEQSYGADRKGLNDDAITRIHGFFNKSKRSRLCQVACFVPRLLRHVSRASRTYRPWQERMPLQP
jgi:hypothetical protein